MEVSESPYCGCLYYSSNALARVMTRMADDAFAVTGLSPSHAYLLMAIIRQPGISSGDLAGIMQLTPSTISRLVEKCHNKGLVSKTTQGRFSYWSPTLSGRQMETPLKKSWQELGKAIEARLGEQVSRELTRNISRAADALEASLNSTKPKSSNSA